MTNNVEQKRKYQVDVASRRVERELDDIPDNDYDAVSTTIYALAENPRPLGVRKIEDDIYRIRIRSYRVIYKVVDAERLVIIGKVTRRSERTYRDIRRFF